MPSKPSPEQLQGTVVRQLVRQGTGSEQRAVVLRTDAGEEVILQRIGGNSFDDPQTSALVGQRVCAEGFRLGRVFRYLNAAPVKSSD